MDVVIELFGFYEIATFGGINYNDIKADDNDIIILGLLRLSAGSRLAMTTY